MSYTCRNDFFMDFSSVLIQWYLEHKRPLPWRQTKNPYLVWLSEIILQQTRVDQGLPYYNKFIESFPTIEELAGAPEQEVLKLWQGLGYYSRARNLHASAKFIVMELDGQFPPSYKELLKLKGVGDYTASAVASICYGEPQAVVDGNVFRALSRIFGIDTPINSGEGKKQFKKLAQELMDPSHPSDFNQGMMEFGAVQCKPQQPLCKTCPFSQRCVAFNQGRIKDLPVKLKKGTAQVRHFNYLVFVSEGKTLLRQRTQKGIWHGLYEFPLVETPAQAEEELLVKEPVFKKYVPESAPSIRSYNPAPIVHKLSHQHIYAKFWILDRDQLPEPGIPIAQLQQYPVPALIEKFINRFDF